MIKVMKLNFLFQAYLFDLEQRRKVFSRAICPMVDILIYFLLIKDMNGLLLQHLFTLKLLLKDLIQKHLTFRHFLLNYKLLKSS